MDHHIKGYFCQSRSDSPKGSFHKVIALHTEPHITWESVEKLVPRFCKGWFELAHLSSQDRIDFTRDFWLVKLPYHPKLDEFINRFFAGLDDIAVFITQQKFEDPYEAHLVYSLKGDNGFFRGSLPASPEQIADLKESFITVRFPEDYLAFLQIHNGFSKTTDCTGILSSTCMETTYTNFEEMLLKENSLTTSRGKLVDPKTLIPFYESFGMPFFQCFWTEWYPQQEMGNVYYSCLTKTIPDVETLEPGIESMAFPSFLDWLMFYMERFA